jgi:DNA-binding response OmpR family regulator
MRDTVLLVEDESDVADLVRFNLNKAGFDTLVAGTGPMGLDLARKRRPDLVILDVMLPGLDGFSVCRELKASDDTRSIPVIMLTAKGAAADRIGGLELGADDYVTKPFSPRELVLRVKALLRRTRSAPDRAVLEVGAFRLDRNGFEFRLDGQRVELTSTEFKLLGTLLERRGRIQTREILLAEVWGYRNLIDTRTVDTHVRRLREKLGDHAQRIETVRGEGYRFLTDQDLQRAARTET